MLDVSSRKLADVAIHYRDASGDAIIVIEAKKRGGALKATDTDPGSYLDLETFAWAPRRELVYIVDASDGAAVTSAINDPIGRSGILTWQELGGLQVAMARELPVDDKLTAFIAGAIQHMYVNLNILPTVLCADYLAKEPAREEINAGNPDRMTMQHWTSQEWRLP